jgi:ribosomal protein S18 acetylase RimI-like enzyme
MGGEPVILRDATVADLPALLALVHRAFAEYQGRLDPPSGALEESEDTLRRALRDGFAVLACAGTRPVGCVFYHRQDEHVYLGRLSVLAAFRRRGIGGALTDEVERRARALGARRMQLGVRTALPALRAYYEDRGYRAVREERHPGYAAPTYVVMEKELE